MKVKDKDLDICGLCRWYDSDTLFCSKHPNWGEMVEKDTCLDYEECE